MTAPPSAQKSEVVAPRRHRRPLHRGEQFRRVRVRNYLYSISSYSGSVKNSAKLSDVLICSKIFAARS